MLKKLFHRVLKSATPQLVPSKTTSSNDAAAYLPAVHGIDPSHVSKAALDVCHGLQDAGFEAYVVGGAVRDMLLARDPKDFDVATNATPEQVVRVFRRARIIGKRFRIVHVVMGRELIETTTFRADKDEDAKTDAHGRVLADNTYGTLATDAARRDLTVNAMYYDPVSQRVLDFHKGMADLKKRSLRMIGDPATRYREDPVRMLRVARFAAKLGFTIAPSSLKPIAELKSLVGNCPPSRLFDEVQKLLLSGYAVQTLDTLHTLGLSQGLLPVLDMVRANPDTERFVRLAMGNTDERVLAGKSVTPSFLFASLLWGQVAAQAKTLAAQGQSPFPAREAAMQHVLDVQCDVLAIPRRYTTDMRDIWVMQLRLEQANRRSLATLAHPRFRAGYDFFMLRVEAGEQDAALGTLWTELQLETERDAQLALLDAFSKQHAGVAAPAPAKKRRRAPSKRGAASPAAVSN